MLVPRNGHDFLTAPSLWAVLNERHGDLNGKLILILILNSHDTGRDVPGYSSRRRQDVDVIA